jgi:hypothetical protein
MVGVRNNNNNNNRHNYKVHSKYFFLQKLIHNPVLKRWFGLGRYGGWGVVYTYTHKKCFKALFCTISGKLLLFKHIRG